MLRCYLGLAAIRTEQYYGFVVLEQVRGHLPLPPLPSVWHVWSNVMVCQCYVCIVTGSVWHVQFVCQG